MSELPIAFRDIARSPQRMHIVGEDWQTRHSQAPASVHYTSIPWFAFVRRTSCLAAISRMAFVFLRLKEGE